MMGGWKMLLFSRPCNKRRGGWRRVLLGGLEGFFFERDIVVVGSVDPITRHAELLHMIITTSNV